MRIAYIYDLIYPYTKGGAEKRFWELAKRLHSRGHEVHVFGMKFWDGPSVLIKDGIYLHGVCPPLRQYQNGIKNLKQVLYFSFSIFPSLWNEKFDIIDCNAFPYLPFFCVKLFASIKKIPLVTTWQEFWGSYWYKYLGEVRGSIASFIEKVVIRLSGNIIVYSPKIYQDLLRCGVREKTMVVIPNGADLKMIERTAAKAEGVDLMFAGRLIKDKNVDMLIRSIFLVKKKLNNIKCLIIGEGPEKQSLVNLANSLGLNDNLMFKDYIEYEEVISYMKSAKVFVLPSTREGFGIVIIEAMACGLSVITVAHPMNASTELIKEGDNGFICKFEAEDISRKIVELLTNENLRKGMIIKAKDSVKDYDWEEIANACEEWYHKVCAGKN